MTPLLFAAVLLVGLAACEEQQRDQTTQSEKRNLDQTATTLPSGVRDMWFQTLDRAIDKRLVVYKKWAKLKDFLGGITYVPLDRMSVHCGWNISLVVEAGDVFFPSVYLIQTFTEKKLEIEQEVEEGLSYFGLPAPELGVGQDSPAALKLMDDLCRHLIDRLDRLSASQP